MLGCRAVLLCVWAAVSTEGSSLANSGWHWKEVLGGPTGAITSQNSPHASFQCPAISAYCEAQANIFQTQGWSLSCGCPGSRPLKLSLCGFRAVSLHLAAAAHGRSAPQRPRPGPQLPQQRPQPAELGLLRVHWHDPGGGCAPRLWEAVSCTQKGLRHNSLGWVSQPSFWEGLLFKLSPLLGRSSRQQSAWRGTLWTAAS